jgi:hypothetical protein
MHNEVAQETRIPKRIAEQFDYIGIKNVFMKCDAVLDADIRKFNHFTYNALPHRSVDRIMRKSNLPTKGGPLRDSEISSSKK